MDFTLENLVTWSRHQDQSLAGFEDSLVYWRRQLNTVVGDQPRQLLLMEPDPVSFLAAYCAAQLGGWSVVLGNPAWSAREQNEALQQIQSGYLLRQGEFSAFGSGAPLIQPSQPWILIPSGGSSGTLKLAIHTRTTISAAVQGFQHHCSLRQISSLCVLPPYHVSGLMQFERAWQTGGKLHLQDWKDLQLGKSLEWDPASYCLSLVPTQLQRLLPQPQIRSWLCRFALILLGGGPTWSALLNQAQTFALPIAPTYGMTETAGQIATLLPQQFLQGVRGCGQVLPHASITILDPQGTPGIQGSTGRIGVQSQSLALGYYPQLWPTHHLWISGDMGYVDKTGELHVVGREQDLIISGGEKIWAPEVADVLLATGLVADVCVLGLPHPVWGEEVVAAVVPTQPSLVPAQLEKFLRSSLVAYKHPKRWLLLPEIPRNPQGKVNRRQIQQGFDEHFSGYWR
jgi:O-succinylbenzoic acid--CoA ligase